MKRSVLEGFARHAVRPAVLIFSLVGMAAVSHCQTATAAVQPATKGPTTGAPARTMAATPPLRARAASSTARPASGQHEGITVHGHWVIEVRNPDGTLVTRREFENMLEQPTGAQTITQLLGGAVSAGQLAVVLPVDCSSGDGQSWCIIYQSGAATVGGITLSTDVTPYFCPTCGGGGDVLNCVQYPTSCLSTLAVSTNGGSLSLMGTVVAEAVGTVTAVQSAQAVCNGTTIPSSTCLARPDATLQPLTGTAITSVPFGSQQSISFSVTISFSSGS
jgi:hypothetical protein